MIMDEKRLSPLSPNGVHTLLFKESPSTGYTWIYQMDKDSIPLEVAKTYQSAESNVTQNWELVCGEETYVTFRLKPQTCGEAKVFFVHCRPWSHEILEAECFTFVVQ
jgi:predicted secreted protein